MSISRPFSYNPSLSPIPGTQQYGTLCVGVGNIPYSHDIGNIRWWNGPDEELGYVIGTVVPTYDQPSPIGDVGSVGFWRTSIFNDSEFVTLSNTVTNQNFTTPNEAYIWLTNNNYWTSYVPTNTPTPTNTETPTNTPTNTPTPTNTETPTNTPTNTPTPTNTETPTNTPTNTQTPTNTPTNTKTPTNTPTNTQTPTNTPTPTITPQGTFDYYVGGSFTSYQSTSMSRIGLISNDGSINTTLSSFGAFNSSVNKMVRQPDGKIIAVGNFTTYSGQSYNRIIRLNPDGTIDPSFVIGGGFNTTINTIELQSDNKILVGGIVTIQPTYSGVSFSGIIRLEPNGSRDTTFIQTKNFTGEGGSFIRSIKQQSDGQILIGGSFTSDGTSFGGSSINITKYNSNGTHDNTFTPGIQFDGTVNVIQISSDNNILVGGQFTKKLLRVNNIGTNINFGSLFTGTVDSIYVQSDGKIVLNNGNTILRLLFSGASDPTFLLPDFTLNNTPLTIQVQPGGKILVGGSFTSQVSRIIRLNLDGTRDTSFGIGTGFNGNVNSILVK